MTKDLGKKSKASVLWDVSGGLVRQLSFLLITIVLKRLLTPEEFGVVALSMVFITISEIFIDSGFTSGLIQQKGTKNITYSSVFYVNLLISIIYSALLILCSPLIADFFEKPIIENVLYFLAIIPPIAALGRVQLAILTKDINFKSLTKRDLVGTLSGGLLGLLAAYNGIGVYSLVIQQITMITVSTMMLWFATGWYPKLEFSITELKKLFSFSGYVFLDDLFRRVASKIDTIFIGKAFSPTILGFYTNAETLKAQVEVYTSTSISKVLFPVFSQLQDDKAEFRRTYLKSFNIVTGLIVMLIGPVSFLSYFIITTLFGEKWIPSVILFQILILSSIVSPHVRMMGRAVLALGYSKLKFKVGILQRLFKLLPICIGLFYGIQEFTIAMAVSAILVFLALCFLYQKILNISVQLHLKGFFIPNIPLILFIIINYSFNQYLNQWLFTLSFVACQLLFLKIIRHESYTFMSITLRKGLQKIKSRNAKKN